MFWYFVMPVAIVLVAVLVLGGVAVLAAGRGGAMREVERLGPTEVPPGRVDAEMLRSVRFRTAFRGYRMDEVDALLDRLAAQAEGDDPPQPWRRGSDD